MKKSFFLCRICAVFAGVFALAAARAAEVAGDYALTFAKIFVEPSPQAQADERAPVVRETLVFHEGGEPGGRETGRCVLEYRWTRPPDRLSSKALDKFEIKTEIALSSSAGEWTARPETVWPNLFFFKAGDTAALDAAKTGKWNEVPPFRLFQMTRMSPAPDQYHAMDQLVSNENHSKLLPFARVWKGQVLRFSPAEHPQAVLIVKIKGLFADGYAAYIYEYDPQGKKKPLPQP